MNGPSYRLRQVADPDDPDLAATAALLRSVFPDENTVLGLDRLREFVAAPRSGRAFTILVGVSDEMHVVGCTVFSYVYESNCGFSEYIAVTRDTRGSGMGRALFDARRRVLDAEAERAGHATCNGLFIEADNPYRIPPELRAQERLTAMDTEDRLRMFAHLGFKRVDVTYVQPPLGVGKEAVSYLDLLFAEWLGDTQTIPSEWVTQTVEPIWRAWAPGTHAEELHSLRARLTAARVALQQLA